MGKTKSYSRTIIYAIMGILMFIRMHPVYFWTQEDILRPICAVIILVICLYYFSMDKWTSWILLASLISYLWASMVVDHSELITIFNFSAFAFILILDRDIVRGSYIAFRKIFVFFLALSIINYLMVILGFTMGEKIVDPLNTLKDYNYLKYPFLVGGNESDSFRFSGLFDEPGVVGTTCGLMLVAERMNLQKTGNIILLIGGLMSLSFYFFVALVFGFIFFSNKLKYKWIYLVLAALFVVGTYNNKFMYDTIWHRFEWNVESRTFVGDNRNGDGLDEFYEKVKDTPFIVTGLGSDIASRYSGASSLRLIMVKHGIVFLVFNLLSYFILAFREIKNKYDLLFFLVFFILTLYQRPGLYDTSSIMLYVMTIYVFAANRKEEESTYETAEV